MPSANSKNTKPISWANPARQATFAKWLGEIKDKYLLEIDSLQLASEDASFRRYFKINSQSKENQDFIIMDAPPEKEDTAPFIKIATILKNAGLNAPKIYEANKTDGFLLLNNLGSQTIMQEFIKENNNPAKTAPLYKSAISPLIQIQQIKSENILSEYNHEILMREMKLFNEWYLEKNKNTSEYSEELIPIYELIAAQNLAAPRVFVHRDYMPRNLMMPQTLAGELGILDFQDALYGPITYDIASLMRDAFISQDEEMVIDITVRYWQAAKKAGLMDYEGWHNDFGSFWRAVEFMGLQRHLKIAGIFSRLSIRDGKEKYIKDTPRFINYIRHTASRYKELSPLIKIIDKVEKIETQNTWVIGR